MLFSNEMKINDERGIFPEIRLHRPSQCFNCLGTTFFINGHGIFVTAKHVVDGYVGDDYLLLIAQQLSDGSTVSRLVTNLCIHPNADIVIGMVGVPRHPLTAQPVQGEIAPNCRVHYGRLPIGLQLMGAGYPRGEKITNEKLTTFKLNSTWSTGEVTDLHPEGFSKLKNSCYQTTMRIESGCSGGPVFYDGQVVGINSSSFDLTGEEIPVSFITPIAYILDLQLPVDDKLMSVREMEKLGGIISTY